MNIVSAFVLFIVFACTASAQIFVPNGDFERSVPLSPNRVGRWNLQMGNANLEIDSAVALRGRKSLHFRNLDSSAAECVMEMPFTTPLPLRFSMKCFARLRQAGDSVSLRTELLDNNGMITCTHSQIIRSMDGVDWIPLDLGIIADDNDATLRIVGRLEGRADLWLDEFDITARLEEHTKAPVAVRNYLQDVFHCIRSYAVLSDSTLLADVQARTLFICRYSQNIQDCYPVLSEYALPHLNTESCVFVPTVLNNKQPLQSTTRMVLQPGVLELADRDAESRAEQYPQLLSKEFRSPQPSNDSSSSPVVIRVLSTGTLYIALRECLASTTEDLERYMTDFSAAVKSIRSASFSRLILDLRDCKGHHANTLLSCMSSVLGDGVQGYSLRAHSMSHTRRIVKGRCSWDSIERRSTLATPPLVHVNPKAQIAVLISGTTAGAGEVLARAFSSIAGAKFFGSRSAGVTSRVEEFVMRDSSRLRLLTAYERDRFLEPYSSGINVDQPCDSEDCMQQARNWFGHH